LFANGQLSRSESMYTKLLQQSPHDPAILAPLGNIALRNNDKRNAIDYWRKALDNGVSDPALCYRYAVLADEMDVPAAEIERALQQAIKLKPDFDDARFKLALLKSNASDFAGAVSDFRAMAKPAPQQAYGYWMALAYALSESGRREEAKDSAKQALSLAASPEQRARAMQIAYVADTDLTVRFARDANGNLQLVTTRVPHGSADFNPFVEAGDHIQVATGNLQEVLCSGGKLNGFVVASEGKTLTLSVPDPTHVLMRSGSHNFYCGPLTATTVTVEYAVAEKSSAGILRGIEFR